MEERDVTQNSQGVGDPYNYLLGGGSTSGKTHSMVFYALTPQVLDVPHSRSKINGRWGRYSGRAAPICRRTLLGKQS